MKNASRVFCLQGSLFLRDKGMLAFYLAGVAIAGIMVPFFSRSLVAGFSMAAFFTTLWLKPMLAESLAGEREKRTLESLLSTRIHGKSVLWGKMLFHLLFSLALFGATAACAAMTYLLAGYASEFALWQWLGVVGMAALHFAATCLVGTCLSATSADLRTANGRVSVAAYPLGLLFLVTIAVVALGQPMVALVVGGIAAALYLGIGAVFGGKAARMKQSRYYENVKARKPKQTRQGDVAYAAPKSPFATVFQHELRYQLTIKSQINRWILACSAIVGCAWIVKLIGEKIWGLGYFDWTVLLIVFAVPSAVRNMAAYAIGGERAYKTGESLLSTPLKVRTIFLAKCALPMAVAAAITVTTSLLTLTGVNIIGRLLGADALEFFTPTQWILLYPAGILACVAMIFLNGILSVTMKTARRGLYVSTALQMVLFAPVAAMIYLPPANALLWAAVYTGALLLLNMILLAGISGNIRRPWLMGKL